MSNPMPDSTVSALRTNETAALAAAMIVAGSFPDIVSFAARVADASVKVAVPDAPKPQRAARGRPKRGNGRDRDAKLAALIRTSRASPSRRCLAAWPSQTQCAPVSNGSRTPTQSNATGNPGASRPLARPPKQPNGRAGQRATTPRRDGRARTHLKATAPVGSGLAPKPLEVLDTREGRKAVLEATATV
jgi:hypothetical protein